MEAPVWLLWCSKPKADTGKTTKDPASCAKEKWTQMEVSGFPVGHWLMRSLFHGTPTTCGGNLFIEFSHVRIQEMFHEPCFD
jgi:hypothetical protein